MKKQKSCFTMFHKTAALLLAFTLLCAIFSGCGKPKAIDCPFTDLGWETTTEELFAAEGVCDEPYKSTYGGMVYTYPSTYMDYSGTIKYMYDENNILMSVAFTYDADDADELKAFYDKLLSNIEKEHGKSSYDTNGATNYGNVWELKEGHIIVSVMLTDSNKALQVAYVNPLDQEKED